MAGPWEQYQQPAAAAGPWTQYQSQQPSEVPAGRRQWSDVPGEALSNLPASAGKFIGGLYEAVTSPIQTIKNTAQLAGGAAFAALPQGAQDWLISTAHDPAKVKQSIAMAKAVGGEYAKRYGTEEGFKEALATDPVGVASDFSTLLSGGAAATAKTAPAVSKGLATAAKFTNPAAPIAAATEYGLTASAKGIGNAMDLLQGERPAVRASNIVRNALSEEGRAPQNVLAAQMALQNAPQGATVRQALSDVTAPQIQYLGKLVESRTPGAAMSTQQAQEAARLQRLQAVTPDLQTAQAMRGTAAGPLYTAATQPGVAVSTAPLVGKIDALLEANPGNAKLVTALNQVKAGLEASTDAQQVSSVLDNLKDLIASKDNKFIVKNLLDVKKSVEGALPGYGQAQQVFAATSGPVNQAQVLGAMQDVLKQPLGVGERAGPFMTAMGRGEQALLKKATGEARFGGLSDVLTPGQMKVVGEVESELMRDAKVAAQAKAGAEAMQTILESNKSKVRLPDFLNAKVTLANQMLRILEGKINGRVMAELEKGFQSGTSFVDLMKKVPASERIEVLRALGQARGELSATKLNLAAQSQNALAPVAENQNALAK